MIPRRESAGRQLGWTEKNAEAEPLLLESYQGMVALKDRVVVESRYHMDHAREWLVQLYQAWGKPSKAAEWRKKRPTASSSGTM